MKQVLVVVFLFCSLCVWSQAISEDKLKLWIGETLATEGAKVSCSKLVDSYGTKFLIPDIAAENLSDTPVTMVISYQVKELTNGIFQVCVGEDALCESIYDKGMYETAIIRLAPHTKEKLDIKMMLQNSENPYSLIIDLQMQQLRDGSHEYRSEWVINRGVKAQLLAGTAITTTINHSLANTFEPSFYNVYSLHGTPYMLKVKKEALTTLVKGVYLCMGYDAEGKKIKTFKLRR